jgi:hypothetical protein
MLRRGGAENVEASEATSSVAVHADAALTAGNGHLPAAEVVGGDAR